MHIVFQLIRWVPSRTKCFRMHGRSRGRTCRVCDSELHTGRICRSEAESELVPQSLAQWQWTRTRLPCAVTPAAHRAQCPWTQALAVLSDCQRDSDMLLFHGFSPATSQRPSEEASAARASLSAVSTVTPRLTASGQFEFTGKYPPLAVRGRFLSGHHFTLPGGGRHWHLVIASLGT